MLSFVLAQARTLLGGSRLGRHRCIALVLLAGQILSPSASYADAGTYSPVVGTTFPTRVYWGDTHLHTRYSVDANMFGNQHLGPAEAFRFARGEVVTASNGMRVQLRRPLDFLMVSDHGEFLGLMPRARAEDPQLMRYAIGRRWRDAVHGGSLVALMGLWSTPSAELVDGEVFAGPAFAQRVWNEYTAFADSFNHPGVFTTFIGYEWTAMNGMDNLHRNVMFADGADKVTQVRPFTSRDSSDPQALWAYLAAYEKTTGGRALAIPHNPNLSGGRMFMPSTISGEAFSPAYARERARWEPITEITQVKGDSETHPLISPNDEYADFGTWDTNLSMRHDVPRERAQIPFEYVRSALKLGLRWEQKLGENPFKFGVIGSTDSHTGLATADEDNYWGKFGKDNPAKGRALEPVLPEQFGPPQVQYQSWRQLASGYAGVWAQDNTREALFDALRRKEVYATTGPRMVVRFFGGWQFEDDDALRPDLARRGYLVGVPMGGELPVPERKKDAPRFLLSASKDPDGANIERLQIVKGWLDASGALQEKVFDVRVTEKAGDTVDLQRASYSNSVGSAQLTAVWRDPDFNPALRAFYYARVLEIPTPRWPVYDAAFFGTALPSAVWQKSQQRAYTSAIWYSPD